MTNRSFWRLFRPRFGPAFLTALVLSGVYLWWRQADLAQRQRQPVIVKHQTTPPGGTLGAVAPDFVRDQAQELGLTPEQLTRVETLAAEWSRETGDLQSRLQQVGTALQAKFASAASGRLTPADYETEAAELQALSHELSKHRRRYWERLQEVLTAEQQQQAQAAWTRAHQVTLGPGPADTKRGDTP